MLRTVKLSQAVRLIASRRAVLVNTSSNSSFFSGSRDFSTSRYLSNSKKDDSKDNKLKNGETTKEKDEEKKEEDTETVKPEEKQEDLNKKVKDTAKETEKGNSKEPTEKDAKKEKIDRKKTIRDIEKRESTPLSTKTKSSSNSSNSNGTSSNSGDDSSDKITPLPNPESGLYPPLLAIPMKSRIPLPNGTFGIEVNDPAVIETVHKMINNSEPYFVLFHVPNSKKNDVDNDTIETKESVHNVGVHCEVLRHDSSTSQPGKSLIMFYVHQRCTLEELKKPTDNFPTPYKRNPKASYATVKQLKDEPYDEKSPGIAALVEAIRSLIRDIAKSNTSIREQLPRLMSVEPSVLADVLAGIIHATPEVIQSILEDTNVETRLLKVLEILRVERNAAEVMHDALKKLTSKADDNQTKVFVNEYIKALKKSAGIVHSNGTKASKFEKRLEGLKLSEEAMEAYKTEMEKLESQGDTSSESSVIEKYLDWLTSIPWGIFSKDKFNIREARKILDREHYGMKDTKERILEFISLGRVSGKVEGRILCLAGPPGTGKTSIAKAIAESLGRKYVRIALGGVRDAFELKGHRRTYIGALPGKVILSLKEAKTSNPLILIDEIDKLDYSQGGGAASALLEILDPEQNNGFVDNFMDIKVDLSKVLFVCTANYLDQITGPLRDRMDIIEVSGYTNKEKIEIAKNHIIPSFSKKTGLDSKTLQITDESIVRLTEKYCRESGVRNIKRLINKIFSKASLKIVEQVEEREESTKKVVKIEEIEGVKIEDEVPNKTAETPKTSEVETETKETKSDTKEEETKSETKEEDTHVEKLKIPDDIKLEITPENLEDYAGPQVYNKDRVYDAPPPGVATGLAFTGSGNGTALYIESILTNSIGSGSGSAGIKVTGSMKDVMKESASIASSFTKLFMVKKYPENRFFESANIHVHSPGGAVPKDGPSAGIAFTSSLLSLALDRSLPPTIAMTGEITVTGRVLSVGGLKEKTIGAKRFGYKTIIFPKDIEHDLKEIPDEIKEGMTFIPVTWYDEVFEQVFPNLTKEEGNEVWKDEFKRLDDKKNSKNEKE